MDIVQKLIEIRKVVEALKIQNCRLEAILKENQQIIYELCQKVSDTTAYAGSFENEKTENCEHKNARLVSDVSVLFYCPDCHEHFNHLKAK